MTSSRCLKALLLATCLLGADFCLRAQYVGTVNFGNMSASLVTNGVTGNPVTIADNVRAALYWAPLSSNAFTQIGAAVPVGVPAPGLFVGGTRTNCSYPVPPSPASAQFQVRAWSGTAGTYEEAALIPGVLIGQSAVVTSPFGVPPLFPPVSLALNGLQGFVLNRTGPPQVTTLPPSDVSLVLGLGSATLRGTVNPGGLPTTTWFEGGIGSAYDRQTAAQEIGAGWEALSVSNTVTELPAGLAYEYRLVASNNAALVRGAGQAFGVPALNFSNLTVAAEAVIRGGSYGSTNIDEQADGHLFVKYEAPLIDFARKAYFQFNLTNPDVNADAPATFAVTTHTVTSRHRAQLWGLNQPYPGFNADITWNTAQANKTDSNDLLTTGEFTATPIGSSVLIPPTPSTTHSFTIPLLGDYLRDNRVTLVLSGAYDSANDVGGLRLQRASATLQVAVPWPQTITGIGAAANGAVTVNFLGGPFNTYLVQTTTNLSAPEWVDISTNVADLSGAWSFTDHSASNCPARFYRSRR